MKVNKNIEIDDLSALTQQEVNCVFEMVCDITGVTKEQILSSKRNRYIVDARKILVNVIRKVLKLTCYQTGAVIMKDHSTVVHYDKMHQIHILEPEYRRMYSAVSGSYLIRKSVRDEDRLQDQFRRLQEKTKTLLDSLEGQGKSLEFKMNTIKNSLTDEAL